jgi:hypothetical protein
MSELENFGMLMAEDSESEAICLLMYRINSLIKERNQYKTALEWIAGWNHQLFDEATPMEMRDKAEQALTSGVDKS